MTSVISSAFSGGNVEVLDADGATIRLASSRA
jgi:hypothetical protein